MSYYTDKVYSSNFLSKSRGLDEMLVQDKTEERPPLPESRQSRLEARLKETTARDTSYTRTKREPRETVLYLGPSRGVEVRDFKDTRELRDTKRKEESTAVVSSRSDRSLLQDNRKSASSYLSRGSQASYTRGDAEQKRDQRPLSMSRLATAPGQRIGFADESPSRSSSSLGAYSSYNTRRSLAPEVLERKREERTFKPSSYSSSRVERRGEERDWLPSSSSSRLLVRGDQRSGVEIFSHIGGSTTSTNIRRPPIDQSYHRPQKEEPSQYHTDRWPKIGIERNIFWQELPEPVPFKQSRDRANDCEEGQSLTAIVAN